MSSINTSRASYNHPNPTLTVGRKAERAAVGRIGVFCAENNRLILCLPFNEASIRAICALNSDFNPLNLAVRLATGVRSVGVFASSTSGVSKRRAIFRGIK